MIVTPAAAAPTCGAFSDLPGAGDALRNFRVPRLQRGFEQFTARADLLQLEHQVRGKSDNAPLVLLSTSGDARLVGSGADVDALPGDSAQPSSRQGIGLRVLRLCTLDGCQRLGRD